MPKQVILTRPPRSSSQRTFVREDVVVESKNQLGVAPPKGGRTHRVAGAEEKKEALGLEELLAAADLLGPSERKQLLDRLSLKRATETKAGEQRDPEMWAVSVYEALGEAIGTGDGGQQGPAIIRRTVGAPQAFAPVAEFMHSSRMQELKATERQAVYSMLARLVVQRAREVSGFAGIPVSAKLVAQASQGIASVFETNFPGYLSSGLAKFVAMRLVGLR